MGIKILFLSQIVAIFFIWKMYIFFYQEDDKFSLTLQKNVNYKQNTKNGQLYTILC